MTADAKNRTPGSGQITKGTILVIGGAGYVGAHAAKALADSGYLPVVYDNMSTGAESSVRFGPLERGDVRDAERLDDVFNRYRPQAVLHCATSKNIVAGPSLPHAYYSNLVAGTLTLLDAMRRHSIVNLCMLTSADIYGASSTLMIAEDAPTEPLTAYGACLNAIENMAADFGLASGLRWISLRLFNVGGAAPEVDLGENHKDEQSLIPASIDAAMGRREYVPIWGSHFATRDGTSLRDYVHVKDVAGAICLALQRLIQQTGVGPYNIGTGRDHSVLEIIRAVETATGKKCPIRYLAKRTDQAFARSANFERAKTELGWVPKMSGLETIIQSAFEYRENLFMRLSQMSNADYAHQDAVAFMDAEVITSIPKGNTDHELLLKKLDEFLKN